MAEAWATLADVKLYYEHDWKGAEENFRRAMELNPSLAMNHYHYAWYLALFSRMDEAIAEHKRAQELDPLTPLHTAWLGGLYYMAGRYDDAIAEAQKCLRLKDNYGLGWLVTGRAYQGKKMYPEAIAAHRKAAAINPAWKGDLGVSYALAGRTAEARAIRAQLELVPLTPFGAVQLARLAAALGDNDKALEYLQHEPSHAWAPWARVGVVYEPLRRDPRFKALLRKWNLPE
jgi:serine/threonine-protein kinase